MKMIFNVFIIITIASIGAIQCSFTVPVNPKPKFKTQQAPYPVKVAVFIEEVLLHESIPYEDICILGTFNTYRVPAGEALQIATQKTLLKIFTRVHMIESPTELENSDITIIFKPYVKSLTIGGAVQSEFLLRSTITGKKNKILYDKEFKGDTKNFWPCLKACTIVLRTHAISDSVNQAYEDAFEQFYTDFVKSPELRMITTGAGK